MCMCEMPDEEIIYFLCFIFHSEIHHDCYAKLSIRSKLTQKRKKKSWQWGVENRKLFLNNNTNYFSATHRPSFQFHHAHDENFFIVCHFSIDYGAIYHILSLIHIRTKEAFFTFLCKIMLGDQSKLSKVFITAVE